MPTQLPRLTLIAGSARRRQPNIPYLQKPEAVAPHRGAEGEWSIVDVGAGSSFNTLDLFNVATCG